jgi:hypothetical protein
LRNSRKASVASKAIGRVVTKKSEKNRAAFYKSYQDSGLKTSAKPLSGFKQKANVIRCEL